MPSYPTYPVVYRGSMPAAMWADQNPVLAQFERGRESDTGKEKEGPGAWNDLGYLNPSGAATVPVKATGAEVNTGTDDAKFVTAKAIEDSDYAKTAAITSAVEAAVSALLDGAPGALDTLNELAAAFGDDANFATTVINALALKANAADFDNVDNTADADKPVSTAQQAALDLKANTADLALQRTTTEVATNVGTKQALLAVVPTGKRRIISQIVIRQASADLSAMSNGLVFGFNAGATNSLAFEITAGIFADIQDGTTSFVRNTMLDGGLNTDGVATDVFGCVFTDASITATLKIDVFFYDVPA